MTTLPGETGAGGAPASSTSDGGPSAVHVRGLVKSYGGVQAVRGIDLDIRQGEIFALLGPNGAGKTTTVEILEGYRAPRRRRGARPRLRPRPASAAQLKRQDRHRARSRPGVDRYLTVAETIEMYAGYYPASAAAGRGDRPRRAREKRDARVIKLSGGQQRRLDVAIALVGDPDLLFLDEPTTGFDPSARREAWEVVKNLAALGKTVLLTTHYMDEAQYLADRVAVIAGRPDRRRGHPATLGRPQPGHGPFRFRCPTARLAAGRAGRAADADGFTEIAPDDSVGAAPAHRRGRSTTGSAWTGSRSTGPRSRTSTWR